MEPKKIVQKDWNGQFVEHYYILNGKKHGKYESYSNDGRLFEVRFYVEGEIHGIRKMFFNNGSSSYQTYFHGILHGESKSYMDEKLSEFSFYINGEPHGYWEELYNSGNYFNRSFYKLGKGQGIPAPEEHYHDEGSLAPDEEECFYFCHKDEDKIFYFPFLPPKPPRLPFTSDRSRYQTLEIS